MCVDTVTKAKCKNRWASCEPLYRCVGGPYKTMWTSDQILLRYPVSCVCILWLNKKNITMAKICYNLDSTPITFAVFYAH